jgi:hypothetical protein
LKDVYYKEHKVLTKKLLHEELIINKKHLNTEVFEVYASSKRGTNEKNCSFSELIFASLASRIINYHLSSKMRKKLDGFYSGKLITKLIIKFMVGTYFSFARMQDITLMQF